MADVSTYQFADDGSIPNHPTWPMIVYKGAFADASGDRAIAIENAFHTNGWGNSWRNGIYPFPHFHSNAHEVLGIAAGSATVRFGGEVGGVFEVEAGDVALLPAGTGHQNLGSSSDLLVIGAYPSNAANWDLCRGNDLDRQQILDSIRTVPLPSTDPVLDASGGIHDHWQ
ncbi:MAG: cupin [Gemmatimonadetes bacterium]|nr:cupin [Gemmatimonadota bacterium]